MTNEASRLADELRVMAGSIRRKPMRLESVIPLMQRAVDEINRLAALSQERGDGARDAARYRWLRAGAPRTTGQPKPGRIEIMQWESRQEANVLKGEALDAAIDAALAASTPQGQEKPR